jgi:voltage-gated sodium channel
MTDSHPEAAPGIRARLSAFLESPRVQRLIIALILVNAVTLGLETSPAASERLGGWLHGLDRAILAAFVVEIGLKLYAQGLRFFRNPWNLFDAAVVGVALVPATAGLSVLRAFRVLRVLRLVSVVPSMRFVVESIARALPGLGSIALLLVLFFYVFSVMATKLYGAGYPQWFGSLGASMFSLFQIMTLEGWAEIAREIMQRHPYAWLFFVVFILLATFTVLNLFIAIIVNAMQAQHEVAAGHGHAAAAASGSDLPSPPAADVAAQLAALRSEVGALRQLLREAPARRADPG